MICSFGCDDELPTITNPAELNPLYSMDLISSNDDKYSITVNWSPFTGEFNNYNLSSDDILLSETTSDTFLTISVVPGTFTTATLTIDSDPVTTDNIIIFSRPVAAPQWREDPFGNFGLEIQESQNVLSWQPSTDDDISSVIIYRSDTTPEYLIESDGTPSTDTWEVITTLTSADTSHTDVKEIFSDSFCYMIKVIDSQDSYRYNYIVCDSQYTTRLSDNANLGSISEDMDSRILIEWETYTGNDFYQYTLYRSDEKSMPEESTIVLAEITNASQTTFDDRKGIGKGKTWYYKLELVNQYGKSDDSTVSSGKSRP